MYVNALAHAHHLIASTLVLAACGGNIAAPDSTAPPPTFDPFISEVQEKTLDREAIAELWADHASRARESGRLAYQLLHAPRPAEAAPGAQGDDALTDEHP